MLQKILRLVAITSIRYFKNSLCESQYFNTTSGVWEMASQLLKKQKQVDIKSSTRMIESCRKFGEAGMLIWPSAMSTMKLDSEEAGRL